MTVLVLQVTQDEAQLNSSERLEKCEEYGGELLYNAVALSPGVESVGDG